MLGLWTKLLSEIEQVEKVYQDTFLAGGMCAGIIKILRVYFNGVKRKKMDDCKILITGATGVIGQALIKRIQKEYVNVSIVAMVRNKDKAIRLLGEESKNFLYLVGDVCSIIPEKLDVDYIIHGAGQTSSKAFIDEPVETIMTAFQGTKNMLDIAKLSNVKGFVYLSSMEVYGSPSTDEKINETHSTNLNAMRVRSCYPESKRICESLCTSYMFEYGVAAKVVRLAQTFGLGVQYNDNRVFAEFARCAIEGRNIVLKTKGETKRSYLYTEDAADAILKVLLNGAVGEAYNAANEETYCSIYEMALMVAEKCADGRIEVIIDNEINADELGYAPVLHMNLDTSKLQSLGWKAEYGLEDMFKNMIGDMKERF